MRQGWALTKRSWSVLRGNRELFKFPIVGGLLALMPVIVLLGPGLYLIDDGETVVGGLLAAVGIYLASFTATYFAVALAATADATFHGREASFATGMSAANERVSAIAGWAALSALVGTAFAALRQGGSIGEVIIGTLGAAAWGLITFLAVPVIALEGLGPIATLKRSASLFKERWAGQVTGNVAIGGIVGLLGVLPAVLLIAGGVYLWVSDDGDSGLAAGAVIIAIGALLLTVSMVLIQAMRGVFGVALYRYASSGETSSGFTAEELESAVHTKGGRGAASI
jgi:hypothetical protein